MLKPNFTAESFKKELEKRFERIRKNVIKRLIFMGEECLTEAKIGRGYEDQSGNLNSSVGYVIVDHGKIINIAGFEKAGKGSSDGKEGMEGGKGLAEKLAKSASDSGYALIVVAGMHYAMHVEAMGLNVLSSAELLAERKLPDQLRRIKTMISKIK